MKVIVPTRESGGSSCPRSCEANGCAKSTREGKPYCPDHFDLHPYVKEILAELGDNKAEQEKVRKKGSKAVNLKGMTANEIRLFLGNHGSRTVERLARDLTLDVSVVRSYVASMSKQGQVILGRTTRGTTTVRLSEDAA